MSPRSFSRLLTIVGFGIAALLLLPVMSPKAESDYYLPLFLLGLALFVAVACLLFRLIKMAMDRR
jgi:hypothetical protein